MSPSDVRMWQPIEGRPVARKTCVVKESASPDAVARHNDQAMRVRAFSFQGAVCQMAVLFVAVLAGCANAPRPPQRPPVAPVAPTAPSTPTPPTPFATGVQLGIDVLEQQDFTILRGKRVGLLTHPAGVNRFGVPTVDVMRRDKRVNLVALFGVEHGIRGEIPAGEKYEDHTDDRTGLPVFSLYSGRTRSATPEQLRQIDVLVIDLQDIGTRSYTFISAMLYQLEACFQNNVEVVLLDRPNPLGGLKVSGPITDPEWINYLAAYRIPYVHGLTMGELARLAVSEPGAMKMTDDVRRRGKLVVVPMRGWTRSMTWTQTSLRWVPTSPYIQTFDAVVGYPMTGLGAQLGGFRHGIGTPHPFRFLTHPSIPPANLAMQLNARHLPGLTFSVRDTVDAKGRPMSGVYVEVADWSAWRPTELAFNMMQIACVAAAPRNPFAQAAPSDAELYNKHVASTAWWRAITHEGARVNVANFFTTWEQQAQAFQKRSRPFWLYPP